MCVKEEISPWIDAILCAKEMGLKDIIDEMRSKYDGVTISQPEVELANLEIEWEMEIEAGTI